LKKLRIVNMFFKSLFLSNYFGFRGKILSFLKKDTIEFKKLRLSFADTILNSLSLKVYIYNKNKIPKNGSFLVIVNHRGILDPLIVEKVFEKSDIFGHWVAKKELYNSIFFGTFVRNTKTIKVDRDTSNQKDFFKEVSSVFNKNESVFIFPEGTRNKTNDKIKEFKRGFNLISKRNKINILPLYIRDRTDRELKNSLSSNKYSSNVEVIVGDLISYKEKDIEGIYKTQFNID